MTSPPAALAPTHLFPKWGRWAILLAGLMIPQIIEYGPSLFGDKVLLPLDLLALPRFYLPDTPEYRHVEPLNQVHSDMVLIAEPMRRFAASEVWAGRFPTWNPYGHAGTPFVLPFMSPFVLAYLCFPGPEVLAWLELLKALVAGLGAYLFFRNALQINYWPATLAAWCFPLSGYQVLWQGQYLSEGAIGLPWVLLGTHLAVRRPGGWGGIALAAAIALTSFPGGVDVVGEALVASGLYSLILAIQLYGRPWQGRALLKAAAVVILGWSLGLLLNAPYLLPISDFASYGSRIQARADGVEERPPIGLEALAQVVVPYCYGTNGIRTVYLTDRVLPESAATSYAGVVALLVLAPLAFMQRARWPMAFFWLGLGFLGIAWQLDVPGLVSLMRLPGVNMFSWNRFTLLTCFSILSLAALGLDSLSQGFRWRWWCWGPVLILAGALVWSFGRSLSPPEPLASQLKTVRQISPTLKQALEQFYELNLWGAFWCGVSLIGWLLLRLAGNQATRIGTALGVALLVELISFGWGHSSQSDRALYYPPLPILERLPKDNSQRSLGIYCLPPTLSSLYGLRDVRGYDGVDPRAYVDLLTRVSDPKLASPNYARTQWFVPKLQPDPDKTGPRLPPLLNLLGTRYLVFRGSPAAGIKVADWQEDYFVVENSEALPRAFVPTRVEPAPAAEELLRQLTADTFTPREIAYVEGLSSSAGPTQGTAVIVDEVSNRVTIEAELDAPGWLVLADSWFPGWKAEVNGQPIKVHRANSAFRGVELPAGRSRVIFAYRPPALRKGLLVAGCAAAVLFLWTVVVSVRTFRPRS